MNTSGTLGTLLTMPDEYIETVVTIVQQRNQGGGREHRGEGTYTELEKTEEKLSKEYCIYDCTIFTT